MSWDKIISALLNVNPISAISVTFTLLFLISSRYSMKNLEKMHVKSMDKVKEAYSDSIQTLKTLIEKIIKK